VRDLTGTIEFGNSFHCKEYFDDRVGLLTVMLAFIANPGSERSKVMPPEGRRANSMIKHKAEPEVLAKFV
jgi:hypothetical protein